MVAASMAHHPKRKIKTAIKKTQRNQRKFDLPPFLREVKLTKPGSLHRSGPFRSVACPSPIAPSVQVFPFMIAGALSLIQVQADPALAGELYSADI